MSTSFVRWQQFTISQFSFFTNLIMTFALGAIGFILNVMVEHAECQYYHFRLLAGLAAVVFGLSLLLGILLAINRLIDFRSTARIARIREKYGNIGVSDLRREVDMLGRASWALLLLQTLAFMIATSVAASAFVVLFL